MNHYANQNPNDIEFQDLDAGRKFNDTPLEGYLHYPGPLAIGADVFHEKERQHRRGRRTILALAVLAGLLLIATATLSALYVTRTQRYTRNNNSNKPSVATGSWVPVITTSPPPMTVTTTALTTSTIVRLRPTTDTVVSTSISTETTKHRAQTTSVTAIITTTMWLTTSQVSSSSSIVSSSSSTDLPPPRSNDRCIPGGLYGGEELHVLDGGYDLNVASAVEATVSDGLGIGTQDFLYVGLRSIFQCATEDELRLFRACQNGYIRSFTGVACNGPAYTTLPIVVPVTKTAVKNETVTVTS